MLVFSITTTDTVVQTCVPPSMQTYVWTCLHPCVSTLVCHGSGAGSAFALAVQEEAAEEGQDDLGYPGILDVSFFLAVAEVLSVGRQ